VTGSGRPEGKDPEGHRRMLDCQLSAAWLQAGHLPSLGLSPSLSLRVFLVFGFWFVRLFWAVLEFELRASLC
jgi:hypothetical protein